MNSRLLTESFLERVPREMIARDNRGNDVWPAPVVDLDAALSAISPSFFEYANQLFEAVTVEDAASALRFPSGLAELMYLMMHCPESAQESRNQVIAAGFLLKTIARLRSQDNGPTVHRLEAEDPSHHELEQLQPQLARQLGMLSALMNLYCEYTFFAFVGFGKEVHGPYAANSTNAGRRDTPGILAREFFRLNSPHWDFSRHSPITALSVVTLYKDSNFDFDFMGRLNAHGALPHRATRACLLVNGTRLELTSSNLDLILQQLTSTLSDALDEVAALPEEAMFQQLAQTIFEYLRPLSSRKPGTEFLTAEDLAALSDRYSFERKREGISRSLREAAVLPRDARAARLRALLEPGNRKKWHF